MGRATGHPSLRDRDPWYTPAFALADMGAATARGVTRGTLGLPGDLESLIRHLTGGKQYLPTSEDFDKILPPLDPLISPSKGERHPYDTLGMYYNLPIYGGTIKGLSKGTKKVLDTVSKAEEFTPSRRTFLKGSAAIAGATALGAKGLGGFGKVGKEAIKVGEEAKSVTKVADNIPKHKFNSLAEYNKYLNDEADIAYKEYSNSFNGISNNHIEDAYKADWKKELAQAHEDTYKSIKNQIKNNKNINIPKETNDSVLNAFSPQAKEEMRALKEGVIETNYFNKSQEHWSDYLDNPDSLPIWF